jgi:hypothetical protein
MPSSVASVPPPDFDTGSLLPYSAFK